MPREFDSDAPAPVLRFTENVECPRCGEMFEGIFTDQSRSLSVQDMTDPPVGHHECCWCGHLFTSELSGWMLYGEAG